jgi:nucleotide-binding universal stress UspA family protein
VSEQVPSGSIVVGVDGSDHARRAASWAAEQARLEHRRLVLVTVGRAVVHEDFPDVEVQTVSVDGDPRQVLLDLSSRAHLLVVGSRGRGALSSMLLGSVSAAVSDDAACPVVVCRPSAGQRAGKGVVVGADATPESRPVIEFAYRQAALRGLPLSVLHCFWDAVAAVAQYREARGQVATAPELEDLRAVVAESVAGLAEEYPDVRVDFILEHGLVDEALSRRGDAWDLVVVGRHPMQSLHRVLTGSISRTVVERAHTTVAVVPEGQPRGEPS